jgi:hypothetical protein
MPVIPALGRQKQENHKFEISLDKGSVRFCLKKNTNKRAQVVK